MIFLKPLEGGEWRWGSGWKEGRKSQLPKVKPPLPIQKPTMGTCLSRVKYTGVRAQDIPLEGNAADMGCQVAPGVPSSRHSALE